MTSASDVIVGINCPGREPSACVIVDGHVCAFAEEERFTREKHAEDRTPIGALASCLNVAGVDPDRVSAIAYPWDVSSYDNGNIAGFYERMNAVAPPDAEMRYWQANNLRTFGLTSVTRRVRLLWRAVAGNTLAPKLESVSHHLAHAVGGFHASGFDKSLVVVLDGNGDTEAATVWRGTLDGLELLDRIEMPHSLGWFYSTMTEYLGFEAGDGEYKVMGLAPYGHRREELLRHVGRILSEGPQGRYRIEPRYLYAGDHKYADDFTDELVERFGVPPRARTVGEFPGAWYCDLAFAVQAGLEAAIVRLVEHWTRRTGLRCLCLNGGVALNCKANGALWDTGLFDDIYIPPVASDAGQSLGAAAWCWWRRTGRPIAPLARADLGPAFDEDSIQAALERAGMASCRPPAVPEVVANLVASGRIVAWFQGRMEAGPRALGQRSILADPRHPASRDRLNGIVKNREAWRPFCPSILEEYASRYLERPTRAPFMNIIFQTTDAARREIPATVHVDGTTRPQLVSRDAHPLYWDVINAFFQKTGVPAVLNTSFNVRGEPVVCSPVDAVRCFASTALDALAIGPFVIHKRACVDLGQRDVSVPSSCMVQIPAGDYPIGESGRVVQVGEFWMDRVPVTNAQYALFLSAVNGCGDEGWRHPLQPPRKSHVPQYWHSHDWNGPEFPVVGVDWWDAYTYARWAGKSLPTEVQWEAAAAGPAANRYPWGDAWDEARCNSRERWGRAYWRDGRTSPVETYPDGAAWCGALDMAGNVWEWTACSFGISVEDTELFGGDGTIAIRGGSFRRAAPDQRCVVRDESEADCRGPNNGFRCCRPATLILS